MRISYCFSYKFHFLFWDRAKLMHDFVNQNKPVVLIPERRDRGSIFYIFYGKKFFTNTTLLFHAAS